MKTILVILFTLISSLAFCQQPRQATLAQQKMCAERAEKVFLAQAFYEEYTSHYDPKANVCYLWEVRNYEYHLLSGKIDLVHDNRIVDAFEGRQYARFETSQIYPLTNTCWIASEKYGCKDYEDFSRLVEKDVGIGD